MGLPHPFNELLRDAYHASEEQDMFDLDSNDPESVRLWKLVCDRADRAEKRLIDHILAAVE